MSDPHALEPSSPTEEQVDAEPSLPPTDLLDQLIADVERGDGELSSGLEREGAIGTTMFDLPGSEDNSITVLLPQGNVQQAPSQALVRIKSLKDQRRYLGIVTAGPFAEPDNLRADSHLLVTVSARGGLFLPPYHGRVQVSILGEELADGTVVPPRLRPLPNSPVFGLSDEESAQVLHSDGDLRLGLVVGHDRVPVLIPSDKKFVLPRHLAILGTTGGGKSTTVARLVQQAQAAGWAVILLDVEGEYTHLHEPADDSGLCQGLHERGLQPAGLPTNHVTLYHLVGRDSANPDHPQRRPFSLQFARLSPYAAAEILGLSEAQQTRFFQAYDIAKEVLRDLGIFPQEGALPEERARQERMAMELDEFERGYPRLTLPLLMDVAAACMAKAEKSSKDTHGGGNRGDTDGSSRRAMPVSPELRTKLGEDTLRKRILAAAIQSSAISWRALLGRLGRLNRLRVFDTPRVKPILYKEMLRAGQVSILDLSDSGASELNNLVIADLLRGVQQEQERAYRAFEKNKAPGNSVPARVLLILEEAHEFVSAERIDKMSTLLEQIARIAKRGRKRWLSLAFVTQLPQHLPRQLFGLVNSYILHKITDPQVINTLQRTISGIDTGLWSRLSGLAPGQAIVSFPHLTRPLLVAVDPSPAKLRMMD